MLKAIIFDVDGTLVDSVLIHARSWHDVFSEYGFDVPVEAIRGQIGKGGDQLMPVFLPEHVIDEHGDAISQRRTDILESRYFDDIEAFPAVRDLFARLRADGYKVALASSAHGDELDTYKRKAGIEDLVEEETSSDDAERSKPHGDIFQAALDRLPGIDPAEALVIGDTPYDAQAASKVGLRTIGVLSGGFSDSTLREAGCIAVYRDPADLMIHYETWLQL